MNVKKMASEDAANWAYAEMFFGEGAGTRRKLLEATIATRVERITGYHEAFKKAYEKQDMAKHAINAAKERQRLDHIGFIGKNFKAIVRGDVRNVSPVLLVGLVGAYYAHQTGLDRRMYRWARTEAEILKTRAEVRYDAWKRKQGVETQPESEATLFDIRKPYGGL